MRILIAEDDQPLCSFLAKVFEEEGYCVDTVADGDSCRVSHSKGAYDLVLLDICLPQSAGMDLLELATRGRGPDVIVMTANDSNGLAVRCLELGAQDFVRKPISVSELVARSKAVLARRAQLSETVLSIGLLKLNRGQRTAHYGRSPLTLTMKEFALLELLMTHAGECCDKDDIMRTVWHAVPEDRTNIVEVYIRYLRKKLIAASGTAHSANLIQTVKGKGYILGNPTPEVLDI